MPEIPDRIPLEEKKWGAKDEAGICSPGDAGREGPQRGNLSRT